MIDIVDGGLPEHWAITREYNETIYYITKQINNRFPRGKNLLISTQWEWMIPPDKNLNSPKFEKHYDNVFILSTLETVPSNRVDDYEAKGNNVYYIGNTTGRGYFSFWSMQTKNFKRYSEADLKLSSCKHRFLCYNRNPHEHRLKLVNEIIKRGDDKHGIVTLSDSFYTHNVLGKYPFAHRDAPLTVDEEPCELTNRGEKEALAELTIPHDTYTLGNMDIWRHAFLVVVTETTVDSNIHLSEKVFKPMLGKRPFVVLGDVGIEDHLKTCGFKTFGNYFDADYDKLPAYSKEKYIAICDIITKVSAMSEDDIYTLYNSMQDDIEHNYQSIKWFQEHNQLKIQNKGLFRL